MKVKMEMVMNDFAKSLHFATDFVCSVFCSPPPLLNFHSQFIENIDECLYP
jgi:hypothetical protein